MELESRYVLARIRAVEERLKAKAEAAQVGDQEEGPARSGAYLTGYGRGLLEAMHDLKRLREALASLSAGPG